MDGRSVSSLLVSDVKSSPSRTPEISRKHRDKNSATNQAVGISRRRSQSIPFDSSQMLPELDSLGLKVTGDARSVENIVEDKVISLPPIDKKKTSVKSHLLWKDTSELHKRKNEINKAALFQKDKKLSPKPVRAFETHGDTTLRDGSITNRSHIASNGMLIKPSSKPEEDSNQNSLKRYSHHKRQSMANIYDGHKDFLQMNRARSRSTNVPPVFLNRTHLSMKYPLATQYLQKWAGRVRSKSRVIKTELENLTEDSEDGCSRSCILELFSRFPSSPEFAQVMHELCEDIQGYTSL